MAIIRSKIARQLLAEGGAPRKGYFDAGRVGDPNTGNLAGSLNEAAGLGNTGQDDIDSGYTGGDFNVTPQRPSIIDKIGDSIENRRQQSIRNFVNRNMMSTRDAILSLNPFGPRRDMNLFDVYQQMNQQGGLFAEGLTGTNLNMNRARSTFDKLEDLGIDVTQDIGPQLDKVSTTDFRKAFGLDDRPASGGDSAPVLPRLPQIAQVPSDVEQQKSDLGEFIASIRGANPTAFNIPERFRLAEGGEPRQEYGLGSIVKKITGTVKKVAKSPIGKAALAGAALYYGGGGNLFGLQRAGMTGFSLANLPGASLFTGGLDKIPGGGVTASIVGTSLLGGLLASKEPEQDINALSQRISDQTGIDVSKIRGEVQQAYQNKDTSALAQKYPFLINQEYSASFATGGRIGFANGTKEKPMTPDEYFKGKQKFNKRKMLEDMENEYREYLYKQKYGPRNEAATGGDIEDTPKKEGIMMAGYGYNEAMSDTYDSYLDMKKKGLIPPTMDFDEFLQEVVPEMSKKEDTSGMMASAILGDESDEIAMNIFGKPVKDLNPSEFREFMDYLDDLEKSFRAEGGRIGAQEGGMMNLGGNEMDLRGGGFVPIGAKEKADDVPARLSKNEFVFTADAVRAAGGGSVDRGADLMYKTMKQLENKVV